MSVTVLDQLIHAKQWLIAHQPSMIAELTDLCNLNSGSDNFPGLVKVAEHIKELFSDLGVDCEPIPLANRQLMDDQGRILDQSIGPALRWQAKNNMDRHVLLAIHYDTVYEAGSPFQNCTRIDDDVLRGPGVIDAKGGIITLRWAIKAGREFGLLDGLNWSVVLNPDEEVGSPSSSSLWQQLAPQFDFGLLFEPTLADGSLVNQRKGSGNFALVVHGRSAHSGRNFADGRNAIVQAARLADQLDRLNGQNHGVTINIGRFSGGGPLNMVPDLAVLRVNVRVQDAIQQSWIETKIGALVDQANQSLDGIQCELRGGFSSPPKTIDSATQLLIDAIESSATAIGQGISWKPSGGASDGNKLASFGLPNIDSLGPEGDDLHTPNEWIRISSLPNKSLLTLSILAHFGAGQWPQLERRTRKP